MQERKRIRGRKLCDEENGNARLKFGCVPSIIYLEEEYGWKWEKNLPA